MFHLTIVIGIFKLNSFIIISKDNICGEANEI